VGNGKSAREKGLRLEAGIDAEHERSNRGWWFESIHDSKFKNKINCIMFRPDFIEEDNMLKLGFILISDKDNYLKYVNNGKIHYNVDYNDKFPEPKGKVYLYFNCNYNGKDLFLGIRQDGDTRNVYNGICNSEEFLKTLLYSVR